MARAPRKRLGRVEVALERDLATHSQIGPAERAALRSQARAIDVAEAAADPYLVTTSNHAYLELRKAAGLTLAGVKAADPFDDLLAELARPGAGVRDQPNP